MAKRTINMGQVISFFGRNQSTGSRREQLQSYDDLRAKTLGAISEMLARGRDKREAILPEIELAQPPLASTTVEGQLYPLPQLAGKIVLDQIYLTFLSDHSDIPPDKTADVVVAQCLGMAWIDSVFSVVVNHNKSSVQRKNARVQRPQHPVLWKPSDYNPNYALPQSQHVIKNRVAARVALDACRIEDVEVYNYRPPYQMHVAALLDPMSGQDVRMVYENATVIS